PVITCPADTTVSNDAGLCGATVNSTASATDNCGTPAISYGNSSSFYPVGSTTVTATATDACGNSSNCSYTITVNDTEAPNAVCQNLSINLDANGNASISTGMIDGGSTDNCG